MTIGDSVRQGLHYARTCRSLWIFGFFVGAASGGSNGGGGGNDGGGLTDFTVADVAPLVLAILVVMAVVLVMRFLSEGALIEGIDRIRRGGTMTVGEGFRAGWAHFGVLLRIGLLYVGVTLATVLALGVACLVMVRTFGMTGAILFAIPALLAGLPWLVTLYLVQAFAARIAVLENRHALDAIHKARLFLHGRLRHGLKLMVATFAGSLLLGLVAAAAALPIVLLLIALIPVLRVFTVIVLGCLVLVPGAVVFTSMLGVFRSSVWTVGYVTQVEA